MCTPQGIIEKVGCLAFDEAVKAAIKAGKYVLNYTTNLEKLQAEMRSLEDRSEIIERKVGEANDRGEEVENAVLHWRANADEMKNDVQVLMAQSSVTGNISCFTCSSPNIKRRYKLSKEAEEKKADVQKLTQDSHFDEISHPRPPPLELEFRSKKNYVNFDSRTPVFNDIIKALKDPSVNIVGIHGLGGVGKTTLAEQVGKEMRDDGTFKQVPLVAVSKDLNVEEIQSKLADRLDFTLDVAVGEKGRASQLWNKFTNGEKYLVILDDIWKEVDIEAIGIPIKDGKTGCKVLLTSRNEDLMSKMEVDRSFSIAELLMPEAWTLFKKLMGNSIDESQTEMRSLAYEVCKKCKGLPVAINALGAALKNKPYPVWKNALDKLEGYMITNIEGIDPSVWASLKLSYDMLGSSDAKSCFLLCCLYQEDYEISIEDLMRQCVARRLFSQNPRTIDQARNAAHTVVHYLKSASLLSYGNDENFVRIHDVIRDVGISIASKEEAFLVDHGALKWPRNPINGPPYSAISLRPKKIERLPNELTCPQLHTLMFGNSEQSNLEVPDNFFSGMKQLVVLIVDRMRMGRLPSSLANLDGLGMLCLEHCKLADIAILGGLKTSLEVLSLRGSTIVALPQEIGQLRSLLLLDLRDCAELKIIPQGVISNLTSLEELYLPDAFDQWEATEDNKRDTNIQKVTLEELRWSLSTGQLTTLHIHIPNVMLLPKEGLKFEYLKRFRISMGSNFKWDEHFPGTRVLKYEGSSLKKEFIPLVDRAEALYLSGIKGLKNVLDDRGVGNEFLGLKCLKVESCDDDLEYLIGEPKSSVRSHGMHSLQSLTKLVIENCKLKYLFSPSSARGLVNLEQLIVKQCEIMEAIVGFEGQKEENEVIFSKLKVLRLERLPNLKCFYAENEKTRTTMGSSFARVQPLFNEKVIFPVLEELKILEVDKIIEIWDKQSLTVFEAHGSFCQLLNMEVSGCNKLTHLFPSKMHRLLKNLKELEVEDCETMEGVVGFEGDVDEDGLRNEQVCFSTLGDLSLKKLPKLVSFSTKMGEAGTSEGNPTIHAQPLFNGKVILPVLEELEVEELDSIEEIWDKQSPSVNEKTASFSQLTDVTVKKCEKLMNLGPWNILSRLRNLQRLTVDGCPNVEFIVLFKNGKGEEEVADDSALIIPLLKHLYIEKMEKLKSFYSSSTTANAQSLFNHQVILPSLEVLEVQALDIIKEIWDKQSTSVIKKTASFSQLRDMTVNRCKELVNLGPANILPRLQNLQSLTVGSCPNVEVIVLFKNGKEEEVADDNTFIIPQLRYLAIRNMEKLKSFCSSSTTSNAQSLFNHQVCFSQLTSLCLEELPKLVSFCTDMGEAGIADGNPTIHAQPLFNGKVILPVLEELKVESLDSTEEIWDKQSPLVNQETASFGQLRNIKVKGCMKLMNLVPSNILPWLRNLQTLKVNDCPNVEFIVFKKKKGEEEAADDSTLIIPQLRCLAIKKMKKLKRFYSSSTTSNAQSLFNHQVILPVLEELKVEALNSIEEIWDKQSPSVNQETESFGQLRNIEVKGCKKLMNLVPSNILPRLRNLQFLKVKDCPNVEFIVFKNKKGEEEAVDDSNLIISQLRDLRIWKMEKLKSFYSSSTTSNAQSLFNHQVAFPALEDISISGVPIITDIWVQQPLSKPEKEVESFCKLKSISVWGCEQLEYVLPSYMLPQLHNLLELKISFCKELEVIVSNKLKEKEATNNDILVFPQLNTLELEGLDKLKCFCTGTDQLLFSHKVAFPALEHLTIMKVPKIKEIWDKQPLPEPEKKPKSFYKLMSIHVDECDQLAYVFPSYMLPQLQNLEKLVIANCKEMEVIISNKLKEKEATNNDIIPLAKLKTVILQNLPNLKRLCAEMQLSFSNKDAFPVLEINTIEVAKKEGMELLELVYLTMTSCIDPDLKFLVDGTSRKEESSTSRAEEEEEEEEEEEDGEEDIKKADDNEGGGGREEKDEDEEEEETEDHISNLD